MSDESVPVVGLADAEGEERPEVTGLPIAIVACERCGSDRVIVPIISERSPWCGACRPALVGFPVSDRELYPVLSGPPAPLPQGPWETTYGPEPKRKAVRGEAYPVPVWTSRDEARGAVPAVCLALAERARGVGAVARVQSSRGSLPHSTHGAPTTAKTLTAVVMQGGRWGAYAVHNGTGWSSVTWWGQGLAWFSRGSITDLHELIDADGDVAPDWLDAIRRRLLAADARRKAAPKKAASGKREGLS